MTTISIQNNHTKKKEKTTITQPKPKGYDVFSRYSSSSKHGKGSSSGWTICPLCPSKSSKRFALGRGIANHLHVIHTPWNPGKAELKKREGERRRIYGTVYREFFPMGSSSDDGNSDRNNEAERMLRMKNAYRERLKMKLGRVWDHDGKLKDVNWSPGKNEVEEWGMRVLELISSVELRDDNNNSGILSNHENAGMVPQTRAESESNDNSDNHKRSGNDSVMTSNQPTKRRKMNQATSFIAPGHDRSGKKKESYAKSLPPLLIAAKDGDLVRLKDIVHRILTVDHPAKITDNDSTHNTTKTGILIPSTKGDTELSPLRKLLATRDRNESTAEHWAAGGGHLDCLSYLMDLQQKCTVQENRHRSLMNTTSYRKVAGVKKIVRRRDGKTSLHYAARNGHDLIIDYLLSSQSKNIPSIGNKDLSVNIETSQNVDVDVTSGDGTTPLHLACYGGHLSTIKNLILVHGANIYKMNDWGCGVDHWLAMSISKNPDYLIEACCWIQSMENFVIHSNSNNDNDNTVNVSQLSSSCSGPDKSRQIEHIYKQRRRFFCNVQKQGHTALHKAAKSKNRHVIQWLASCRRDKLSNDWKCNCNNNLPRTKDMDKYVSYHVSGKGAGFTKEEKTEIGGVDAGGNQPSDIWLQVGGDKEFSDWMKRDCNW